MTLALNANTAAKARLVAERVVADGIEWLSADPAGCRECGADFLRGESHARTCLVGMAEEVLLEMRGAE